jgi:hypothetical protein
MENKHLENLSKITELFNKLGNLENFSQEDLDTLKEDIKLLTNTLSKEYDIQSRSQQNQLSRKRSPFYWWRRFPIHKSFTNNPTTSIQNPEWGL